MVIDSIIMNAETTALRTLCDLIFLNTLWFSNRATKPKVVVTGGIASPEVAERFLAEGKADVVAVSRCYEGDFIMKFTFKSDLGELAQLSVSVFLDNIHKMTISVQGTNGKWVEESRILNMGFVHNHYIKIYYGADNIEIREIILTPDK